MITNVQFSTPDNLNVLITFDSGDPVRQPYNEHNYRYSGEIAAWEQSGNTIAPYYLYLGWSIGDAYWEKGKEITQYANALIEDANANPTQGSMGGDALLNKKQLNRRRADRADKLAGDINISPPDKEQAKTDQKLSEYETKISADENKASSNMMKLNTVDEVMAFDVPAENWNVWAPPV